MTQQKTQQKQHRKRLLLPASAPFTLHMDRAVLDRMFVELFLLLAFCHLVAAALARGWSTAVLTDAIFLVYLGSSIAVGITIGRRRWWSLVERLLLLGLVAGIVELATDAAGEQVARSLIYPAGEPMIWLSPIYMPISWMIVLTLLGYLGWRLAGWLPLWLAMALCGLAGALIVPFYEECAWHAGWWHYTTLPQIGHTPVYVLLFEGAVAALLPLLARKIERQSLPWVAARGLLLGAWMPLAAFIAWRLLGQG